MRALKLLLGAVLAATVVTAPIVANAAPTTWYVTPSGPGTSCSTDGQSLERAFASIQVAIDCALGDDTIIVGAGTYTENLSISKRLAIIGAGRTSTTVRTESESLPVVTNSATASITQIRIRSGMEGGVSNDGTLTLSQSNVVGMGIFDDIWAERGGITSAGTLILKGSRVVRHKVFDNCGAGIRSSGTLRINNSQILGNMTEESCGGGIQTVGPTSIVNSVIRRNRASEFDGGGILVAGGRGSGRTIISASKITNNFAEDGGGISNFGGASVMIRKTEISGNGTRAFGGGVINHSGTMTIIQSRIFDNYGGTDGGHGGGIYNSGDLSLFSTQIFMNEAFRDGGGIFNSGDLSLFSTQIFMNTAFLDGGGIYNTGSVSVSADTTVSDNVPNDCVGC